MEHSLALQAEVASRAEKQLGGRGLKRAHDEPAEPRATPAPPPTRKAPKPSGVGITDTLEFGDRPSNLPYLTKPSGSGAAAAAIGSGGLEVFWGGGGD